MCKHMVLEVELALVTGSYNKRLNQRKCYVPIVPAYETHSFNTWNAGFQYMERTVSVHGTQGFNTWNAKYHSLVMLQTIYLKSINR